MKTVDKQRDEKRNGDSNWFLDLFGWIAWELLAGPIFAGVGILYFLLFDRLHITDTTTQVLVVISPLLLLAFCLWRFAKVPLFRVPTSPATDDDEEAD